MKSLYFIIFLLSAINIFAQTPATPAEVLKYKWRYILRNPALDEDPFRANNELRQLEKERAANIRQNRALARMGLPQELPPVQLRSTNDLIRSLLPASTTYVYELNIKNLENKKIQTIFWSYIFFDGDGKTEIGRKQFVSMSGIDPGKTKKIIVTSTAPPIGVVNIAVLNKKLSDQYKTQVSIQRIIYKDGTAWTAP